MNNVKLDKILNEIENQTDYLFIYNNPVSYTHLDVYKRQVEDDLTFATMLKTWLGKKGFSVDTASSNARARKQLDAQPYDCLLYTSFGSVHHSAQHIYAIQVLLYIQINGIQSQAVCTQSIETVSYTHLFMNFPNPSFFGKYFKHHTGLSPSEYKMQ